MIGKGKSGWWGLALGSFLVLLGSCADSRIAGGTGSETTALGARILYSDSQPASDVMVRLIDLESWGRRTVADSGSAVDSVRTDSSGRFRFVGFEEGSYALEILGRGEILYRKDHFGVSSGGGRELGDLRLTRAGRVSGVVRSPTSQAVRVVLSGTGLSARVDSSGGFLLPAVPAGTFELLVEFTEAEGNTWQRGMRLEVGEGEELADLSVDVAPREVLLDDFDDGDRFSLLGSLLGGGTWFYHDDSAYGGTSFLDPVAAESDLGIAITDSSAWGGKGRSLAAKLRIGSEGTARFALVGLEMSPRFGSPSRRSWIDLRSMDSLVFLAKGQGTVRIQFSTRAMALETGGTVQFETSLELSEGWNRFSIPADRIALPPNSKVSGIPWMQAAAEVGSIHFLVNQDADLWLDGLALRGVGLEALLRGIR
ncbi:MAG: hypothetical protein H6686_12500 [Fibrobacteria bacterium]|nr:hypothetical protein [Fibrobacteria bacterium]